MNNEQREQQMMTSAEAYAAEIYKDEPDNFHTDEQLCETINDFCAGWRAADNSRWIPVEERLPEVGEPVWFFTPIMDEPLKGAYQGNDTWWSVEYESKFIDCVTHWMPMPTPPARKETKNEQ